MKKFRKTMDVLIIFYLLFNIVYNLFGWIVPVKLMTPETVDSFIYIVMGIMGAVLAAVDVILNSYWKKTRYCWILYAFLAVMGISTVLNMSFGYMSNLKTIVWTGIQFVLFYSLYQRIDKEKAMRYLGVLWKIISIIWIVPVLYSIFQFLMLDSYYTLIWGKKIKQGLVENRLFGIFSDPNYAAIVSLLLIIGMIFLIYRTEKKWKKAIYIIYSTILFVYIVLSGSRTAEVGLIMTVVVYTYALSGKTRKGGRKLVEIVLSCILGVVLVVSAWEISKVGLEKLPKIVDEVSFVKEYKESKKNVVQKSETSSKEKMDTNLKSTITSTKVLERKDGKAGNISNNRVKIWKSYLKGMGNHLIFGMSPRNSVQIFVKENPNSYIAQTDYETHNGYLSVFVATGFAGSILMCLFIILQVKNACGIFFGKGKMEIECLTCILIITNIAVFTCFFTELFFVNNMLAALFWSSLGMLEYWRDEKNENG